MTFCGGLSFRIDVYRIVRAGLHTGFTADADVGIEIDDAIRSLVHRRNWADTDTGRVGAVITSRNLKMTPCVGVDARVHVFHPGAVHAKGYLVLALACRGTCVTTDAPAIINNEAVIHSALLI